MKLRGIRTKLQVLPEIVHQARHPHPCHQSDFFSSSRPRAALLAPSVAVLCGSEYGLRKTSSLTSALRRDVHFYIFVKLYEFVFKPLRVPQQELQMITLALVAL